MPIDNNDCQQEIVRLMSEDANKRNEKEFLDWCVELAALPEDYELKLKDGVKADIELQPFRWMSHGLDLLRSSKGIGAVQLMNGRQGPFLDSYLPYQVFQMGTEIFLKGMWLCQFDDCRHLAHEGYVGADKRRNYVERLKNDLGHDLLKIIATNREIPRYQADPTTMRFLKIVEGVVRCFYFPLYQADKRGNHWAHSRYPKRFYKDTDQEGCAAALQSYPRQWLIVKLFEPMETHVDHLWQLRAGLLAHRGKKETAEPDNHC